VLVYVFHFILSPPLLFSLDFLGHRVLLQVSSIYLEASRVALLSGAFLADVHRHRLPGQPLQSASIRGGVFRPLPFPLISPFEPLPLEKSSQRLAVNPVLRSPAFSFV